MAARLCLGTGREHLVEEIANDVLLLLWRRQRGGKPPEKPEAWAHRVAWNRALRVARVEGRYVTGVFNQGEDAECSGMENLLLPPDTNTPVVGAEFTERLAAVKRLLDALDSAAKTQLNQSEALLFDLVYKKRLARDQVAERLGSTPEAVRQQWSRLLTKLLGSVRLQLQKDPLCNELLGTVLSNEKVFRRSLLELLRLLVKRGVQGLERLVKSSLEN